MPNTDSKSTSDKEQTQAPQIPPQTTPYSQPFEDDTIDLYGMWNTLWDKKWLVIAVTAISALGSVVYALLLPNVYKAEALLMPPKAKDIQSLNVQGLQKTNSNIVFAAFKNNLISRSLQKKFIEEYGLLDILAPVRTPETRDIEILQRFANMIKVENGEVMSVSIEWEDPEFAAKLVNDYIDFFDIESIRGLSADARILLAGRIRDIENTIGAKKQMEIVRRADQIRVIENDIFSKREKAKKQREDEIKEIEDSISSERALAKKRRQDKIKEIGNAISSERAMAKNRREDEIKDIEDSIRSKRAMAKKRREDQIILYEEAAVIASKLELRDKVDTTNIIQNNQLNISTASIPLYYRGFRALNNEIKFLKNRKSDDPFISGLRDLQEKLAKLHNRKSDDPFIDNLRDLQEKLVKLRNRKSDDLFIGGLRKMQQKLIHLRSRESDDIFIGGLREMQQKLVHLRSRESDDIYIFGLRELQVQLDHLRSLKPDYTFFPGLRNLQEELTKLRSIKIEEEELHAIRIDQPAYPPKSRIKPKRRQIVSLSTVIGFFSGIFLALFVAFVQKHK